MIMMIYDIWMIDDDVLGYGLDSSDNGCWYSIITGLDGVHFNTVHPRTSLLLLH